MVESYIRQDEVLARELDPSFVMPGVALYTHVTKGCVADAIRHRVASDFAGDGIPPDVIRRLRSYALGPFFTNNFNDVPACTVTCESRPAFDAWIANHKTYTKEVKKRLTKRRDQVECGVGWTERQVSPFVKREWYPCVKPPRMIAAVNDGVKVWTGAAWAELNHNVFSCTPNFIKTVPIKERPRYISDKLARFEHVAVADSSRFESIVRRPLMRIEIELYKKFGLDPDCYKGLDGVNHLHFAGGSAKLQAKRMSGEQNTSLGNSILNLLLISFVLHESGLSEDDFYVICEGDDAIIGYNGSVDLSMFEKLCIKMAWDEVDHPGVGGFCGLYFGEALTSMVEPSSLAKIGWSLTAQPGMGDSMLSELQWAKLKSLSCEAPGCPIAWVLGNGKHARMRWKRDYWNVHLLTTQGISTEGEGHWIVMDGRITNTAPTMQQRLDYSACFGVEVSTQLRVEDDIRRGSLKSLESLILDLNPDLSAAAHYIHPGP